MTSLAGQTVLVTGASGLAQSGPGSMSDTGTCHGRNSIRSASARDSMAYFDAL